jgi:hypothetical protein
MTSRFVALRQPSRQGRRSALFYFLEKGWHTRAAVVQTKADEAARAMKPAVDGSSRSSELLFV